MSHSQGDTFEVFSNTLIFCEMSVHTIPFHSIKDTFMLTSETCTPRSAQCLLSTHAHHTHTVMVSPWAFSNVLCSVCFMGTVSVSSLAVPPFPFTGTGWETSHVCTLKKQNKLHIHSRSCTWCTYAHKPCWHAHAYAHVQTQTHAHIHASDCCIRPFSA